MTLTRIVILGGGFAGAACALHLLRDHPGLRAEVTVIEPRAVLGAGLAYSTPAPEHRVNVAASRMSVVTDDPAHFHNWLLAEGENERDPASAMADGRLYPSRAVFARYVSEVLAQAVAGAPGVVFRHVRAVARDVLPAGDGFSVRLDGGGTVTADRLVLAISHTAPDLPRVLHGLGCVIRNPWDVGALRAVTPDARVVVIGTGLTACDVIASLLAQGFSGPITAVSRHGLLPRPRTMLPVEAEGDFSTAPETTAVGLLSRVRRAVDVAVGAGRPWENIVDALRQQSAAAWGTLDWGQRGKLLRHLRTYWDVHRFQCAPQIDATVTAAQVAGQLQVRAAFLVSAQAKGDGAVLSVHPRHSPDGYLQTLDADVVINCTGPGHRSVTATHPVLRGLAEGGNLQADPVSLGILVDLDSRVVKADGSVWPNLYVAGPLARGTHGELMGLQQVNTQPKAVAGFLAAGEVAGGRISGHVAVA